MKYRIDGKDVTVIDGEGNILVSVTAHSPKEAIELRDKAATEGWESIAPKKPHKK